jgi:tRNA modification GTPase
VTGRDTIVARATPPGRGALALVRLSGPGVSGVLEALGAGAVLRGPARRATLVALHDPAGGRLLDRGIVTWYPGPGSYTGEDAAELSLHGGGAVVSSVLEACLRAGARPAEPGEFTKRAWLEGKLDRLQVEAVEDLVNAESPVAHAVAVHQVEGGLSGRIGAFREALVELRALLAHHLDFPDEDDPPTPAGVLAERVEGLAGALAELAATAPVGRLLREGATVVFAGRPNAGKSSLFNALVGEERALVARTPGTTRDAVDAWVEIEGFPFRLVDTAGLRGEDEADPVEAAGIEVARRWIRGARVVLWCRRADEGVPDEAERSAVLALVRGEGEGGERVLVPVMSCADLVEGEGAAEAWHPVEEEGWMSVSARTGSGLGALRERLRSAAFGAGGAGAAAPPEGVLTRERHREAVRRAEKELRGASALLREGLPAEFAAVHLEEAEEALQGLVEPVGGEEVLDHLFRSFCIGK